jgi:hypothetical protein
MKLIMRSLLMAAVIVGALMEHAKALGSIQVRESRRLRLQSIVQREAYLFRLSFEEDNNKWLTHPFIVCPSCH